MVRVLTSFACLCGAAAVNSFGHSHRHQQKLSATVRTEKELFAKLQKIAKGDCDGKDNSQGGCGADPELLKGIQTAMDEVTAFVSSEISDAESVIAVKHAAVDACNNVMNTAHSDGPPNEDVNHGLDAIKSWVSGLYSNHETCRGEEVGCLNDMNDARAARDAYASSVFDLNPALTQGCSCGAISNAEKCESCTAEALTWHDTHVDLLEDHIDWYDVNVTTHNDKLKECNGIQASAELAHCAYATHVSDVCGDHDTCYSEKVDSANDYFATISDLNTRLNDLCFSSAKVKCFVNLFLTAENVKSKITMAAVKGCMDLNPDDCANVESGTLSSKSPCDQSYISVLPGDDKFFSTFYSVISDSSPPASIAACTKEDDADADLCMCPMNFAPVCGEDGKTYSNACGAGCAGVEVQHQGGCHEA